MRLLEQLKLNLPKEITEDKFVALQKELCLFETLDWGGAVAPIFFATGEIVFIKRSDLVTHHKGQIAFIGGRREEEETPIETALREFEEETGVSSTSLEVLGIAPQVVAGSGIKIISVPSLSKISLQKFKNQVISNGEWDLMFSCSWDIFAKLDTWSMAGRFGRHTNGKLLFRDIQNMEYKIVKDLRKNKEEGPLHFWGASARMLWNIYKIAGIELNHQ